MILPHGCNGFHEIGKYWRHKNNTMCRPDGPRTVSTTQVIVDQSSYAMRYHDLLNNSLTSAHLKAKK